MSCGAIVNFANTANRLKETQEEKLRKSTVPGPIRKISAPFKAIASELSTDHKKRRKDSVLNTVAEKLDIPTEAIPTPVRKISAPLKTLASELSPSDDDNGIENERLKAVAQKLVEASDTVAEIAKEAQELVAKEAKAVNEKLLRIAED